MFKEISKRKTFFARSSNQASADSFGLSRGQGGVCILWSSNIAGISPINECILLLLLLRIVSSYLGAV